MAIYMWREWPYEYQPNANTFYYFKLKEDLKDYSWNGRNIKPVYYNSGSYYDDTLSNYTFDWLWVTPIDNNRSWVWSSQELTSNTFTLNFYAKQSSNSWHELHYRSSVMYPRFTQVRIAVAQGSYASVSLWTSWHNIVWTFRANWSNQTYNLYLDWQKVYNEWTVSSSYATWLLLGTKWLWQWGIDLASNLTLSQLICEDWVERTPSQVSEYFNLSKSNYWIT